MGAAAPLRIDLFDDVIEAIRRFDPDTQRSLDSLERVRMLPAREMPLDADGVRLFRGRFRARFEGEPTQAGIYRGVSEGLAPAGIEFYLPLFFETPRRSSTTCQRMRSWCTMRRSPGALQRNWQDIHARYEARRHDIERPVLAPHEIFLDPRNAGAACGLRRDRTQQFQGGS
jgi:transcription-repair coupling factor (superfamily II helicase)